MTSAMVCPRARRSRCRPSPHIDVRRHDLRPWQADRERQISGHAASVRCNAHLRAVAPVRPPRNRAEHGRTDAQDLRKRRGEWAEQGGTASQAGHRGCHHARIDPLGEPGQAEPRAERHDPARGFNGDTEQVRPPVRVREMYPPGHPERRAAVKTGASRNGNATRRGRGPRPRGGKLAVRVDDHDRLKSDPAGAASVPAQLAIAGHGRRLVSVAGIPVVPSSARR